MLCWGVWKEKFSVFSIIYSFNSQCLRLLPLNKIKNSAIYLAQRPFNKMECFQVIQVEKLLKTVRKSIIFLLRVVARLYLSFSSFAVSIFDRLIIINIILVDAKSLQLCPTLCDPMDCKLPGSSVHVILQARILE